MYKPYPHPLGDIVACEPRVVCKVEDMIIPEDEVRGMIAVAEDRRDSTLPCRGAAINLSITEVLCSRNGKEVPDLYNFEREEIRDERRAKKLKTVSSAETEEEELLTREDPLPEELVEKVVAMMPFPSILNARRLNKMWNRTLSATSSENAGFRKMVKSVSNKWSHYCPVIVNMEEEWLLGYDRINNCWQKMTIGFDHGDTVTPWHSAQKLKGAGCLLCGVSEKAGIFVTNVFTKAWRRLPPRPNMEQSKELFLIPDGSDAYKVLLITPLKRRSSCEVCTQLYDSRSNSWSMKMSRVNSSMSFNSSSVYLNGIVYFMQYDVDDANDVLKLLAYDVETGVWHTIPHPFACMLHTIETYELLVCQNQPMVVIHVIARYPFRTKGPEVPLTPRNTLIVFKLDPVSLEIREVSRGPPETISGASATLFASDEESIYFGDPQMEKSSVVVFNVRNRDWSCLPPPLCTDGSYKNKWTTFAFQPGMNPYVAV